MDFLSVSAEYCIAYITLLAIATLRSPVSSPSLAYFLVFWFLPVFPGLTLCLPIRTLFAPLSDYCSYTWIISLPCPVGYCSPIVDPRLLPEYSCVLPSTYLSTDVWPCLYLTMFWNKALHMDPHVSRLVCPVTETYRIFILLNHYILIIENVIYVCTCIYIYIYIYLLCVASKQEHILNATCYFYGHVMYWYNPLPHHSALESSESAAGYLCVLTRLSACAERGSSLFSRSFSGPALPRTSQSHPRLLISHHKQTQRRQKRSWPGLIWWLCGAAL